MKYSIKILIIIMFSISVLYGEGKEFILPYSGKTGEEVAKIIYGETEMTVKEAEKLGIKGLEDKNPDEKVKVKYPKVVFVKNKKFKYETRIGLIKFLNEKGNLKKEIRLSKGWPNVTISKNRKYIAINNVYKYSGKGEGIEDAEFIMLNDEGKELWRMKHHHLAHIIPSPNGKYIVGHVDYAFGDAPIYIYNEKGLIGKIEKDDQSWEIDFSNDGSWFAVIVIKIDWNKKVKSHIDRYRADLIVMDENGRELFRKEDMAEGESSFCELKISEDGIITVTTGEPELMIYRFNKKGKLINSKKEER